MKKLIITVLVCITTMLLIASFLGLGIASQLHSVHAVTGEHAQVNYVYFTCLFVGLSVFVNSLIISARHYQEGL